MLMIVISCSNPNEVCGCFHPTHIEMTFSYQDQAGNDLLNPTHENAINEENVDIVYRKDGRYKGKLNYSESFQIVQREDQDNLLMFSLSSTPFEDRQASILIDFPHASNDTLDIKAEGNRDELHAMKIWYNGRLIWSKEENERYFEITKIIPSN